MSDFRPGTPVIKKDPPVADNDTTSSPGPKSVVQDADGKKGSK